MHTPELESSRHLFQPPLYRSDNGSWHRSHNSAVLSCGESLTLDCAAVFSIMSFKYVCGDRTLVREIKRRPWLSAIGGDGEPVLETIPAHGMERIPAVEIAETLKGLLCKEASRVCRDRKEIYILQSGGLDSRIVAGVLATLHRDGLLPSRPIAVTWGLEDSRDVYYGRMVAETLGFETVHIDIGPEHVLQNIEAMATLLAGLVPPHHLHRMQWFDQVSKDAIVLAGSYGDMVGRAEFSGKHLLEQKYLTPVNSFGLMRPEVVETAYSELASDLKTLHDRTPGQLPHVLCEHELAGHYMRNMIAHTMSIINERCTLYQMFTDPSVYGYMWSIHPALRTDDVYAILLGKLDERLARMPWARTNRALSGVTEGARPDLRPSFHEYSKWLRGPLYDEISQQLDPDWFEATGIFDARTIQSMTAEIRNQRSAVSNLEDAWLWLVSFRKYVENLERSGKKVKFPAPATGMHSSNAPKVSTGYGKLIRTMVHRSRFINGALKRIRKTTGRVRKHMIFRRALKKW